MIFFSLSQELSPFHLKEALRGCSLANPNCLRHYSSASVPSVSLKKGLCEHKHCSMMTVHPVHKMATK